MFDLTNLNDHEFELLCRDIMQEMLGTTLYAFSRGIDLGVDICDKKKNASIIIQAKHYSRSTYAQLKSSLKQEVQKVKKLNPQKYYVCTSQSLTRSNKLEIVSIFDGFMPDISHVIDKNDISNFLENEQNKDIVAKNYKLWLCASDVLSLINNQNVFIDCAELMLDIEEQVKLFVETKAYRDAIERLRQDNIIIIIGAPGVGKSTISKMLLLYYADKGYNVRYASNNNISELKRTLSLSPDKKEIVLLDDFLGQHYLNMKESQPNELKTLISLVNRSKQKKLILNSRVTILNEASQTFITFKSLMDRYAQNKYLLDLDKMSPLEKARILYNHLYFNEIPHEFLSTVKHGQGYLKIIAHKNYNPRIIEYVTQEHNRRDVSAAEYLSYIIGKLDNPEDVWKDEFRNRLDTSDRILMNTIYSLTDTTIDYTILERAFNERIIKEAKGDTSVNQYRDSVIRLTNSLLNNVDDRGTVKLAVINPSINDYLLSELTSNTNEQIAIIANAVYYEQIFKALKSDATKSYYRQKLCSGDYLKMDTLENSPFFYFLKSVVDLHVLDKSIEQKVALSLEHACGSLSYRAKEEYDKIIHKLYTDEFCEYYQLRSIFLSAEKMLHILKPMALDSTTNLINAILDDIDISDYEELISVYRDQLVDKISSQVQEKLSDELSEAVFNVISNADREEIAGFINETSSALEDTVWLELEDYAHEKIKEYMPTLDKQIKVETNDFNVPDMRYYLDISANLSSALRADDVEYDERPYSHPESDTPHIIALFER